KRCHHYHHIYQQEQQEQQQCRNISPYPIPGTSDQPQKRRHEAIIAVDWKRTCSAGFHSAHPGWEAVQACYGGDRKKIVTEEQ
ncbi:hypothetical protein XENORESO_002782, partial [Xenotaenia resolanae]